jgi:hypothetical protein
MPNASFIQTSFLGGEWSSYSQGRTDSERYKTAMNVSFNGYPLEEGSWTRRQGTRNVAMTKGGLYAVLRSYAVSVEEPYQVELGALYARFYLGPGLVFDTPGIAVVSISTATPAVVTATAHGFANADQVMFFFVDDQGVNSGNPNGRYMRNRQFVVGGVTANTFTMTDPVTGANINGSALGYENTGGAFDIDLGTVRRISEVVTPYLVTEVYDVRRTQNDEQAVFFHSAHAPQILTVTGDTADPFAWTAASLVDGPYYDPPNPDTNTTTLDPSGVSGSVTLVASATTNINDGQGFLATDVGRLVRLLWEPPLWSAASSYAVGDLVKYRDQYFVNIVATGASAIPPPDAIASWTFATDAVVWTWGTITARASTTSVTYLIQGDPLPDATPRLVWRMGLFSDTTGWPKFGGFHDGRLWVGGSAVVNRVDGSVANSLRGPFDFQPTLPDGTVADDNAIAATANSEDRNIATWLITDDDGIFVGTKGGEWRGKASANNDPISPSNFDFRRVSKYKCFNAEPAKAPSMTILIQLTQRKIMEWGYYSQEGYRASHLSVTGRHLTASGMAEVTYQADPVPMVWCRREDGTIIGSAYKRDPEAGYHAAWWKAGLAWTTGDALERTCVSISEGVSLGGLSEALWLVSKGPDAHYAIDLHMVEILTPVFEDDQEDWAVWFVDSGNFPQAGTFTYADPALQAGTVSFFGMWNIRGQTVSIMLNGIDLGDFLVTANGEITIDLATVPVGITPNYLIGLSDPVAYGDFGVSLGDVSVLDTAVPYYVIPAVFGLTYESRGQLLRPDFGNDIGAANGPAFSKIRRIHKYSAHVSRTKGMYFGIDFGASMRPAPMRKKNGAALAFDELFSGVVRGKMDAAYDTDGMIAWKINRPYACVITAIGGFGAAQDE